MWLPLRLNALIVSCSSDGIAKAAKIIKNGGIAVFPTDTVYGIGCDPYNAKAVQSVYKIKKRDSSKLFPILGYSRNEISKIAIFDEKSTQIAKRWWPGQITLVLKPRDKKIQKSLNLEDKIAVRVPKNPCSLSLLKKCRLLVGTSANVSGSTPHTKPDQCRKNITGYDVFIDGGTIPKIGESTVVEVDNGEINILRSGAISKKEIASLF